MNKITFRESTSNDNIGEPIAVIGLKLDVLYFYRNNDDSIGLLVKTPSESLLALSPITSIKKALQSLNA